MNKTFNAENVMFFPLARDRIYPRLIEKNQREKYTSQGIHVAERPFIGDLSLILAIHLKGILLKSSEPSTGTIPITYQMLSSYSLCGISADQLYSEAIDRVQKERPVKIESMKDFISAPFSLSCPFLIASTGENFGATVLAYPDFLDKTARAIGENFFIIPSSIHELLLLPQSAGDTAKELNLMVAKVNGSVVDKYDQLADYCLFYDLDERQLKSC